MKVVRKKLRFRQKFFGEWRLELSEIRAAKEGKWLLKEPFEGTDATHTAKWARTKAFEVSGSERSNTTTEKSSCGKKKIVAMLARRWPVAKYQFPWWGTICDRATVTRKQAPPFVMVWAAVTIDGRSPLVFLDCGVKIDAKIYRVNVLEGVLQPWSRKHFGRWHCIFLKDSAPSHQSLQTMAGEFSEYKRVGLLYLGLFEGQCLD